MLSDIFSINFFSDSFFTYTHICSFLLHVSFNKSHGFFDALFPGSSQPSIPAALPLSRPMASLPVTVSDSASLLPGFQFPNFLFYVNLDFSFHLFVFNLYLIFYILNNEN